MLHVASDCTTLTVLGMTAELGWSHVLYLTHANFKAHKCPEGSP